MPTLYQGWCFWQIDSRLQKFSLVLHLISLTLVNTCLLCFVLEHPVWFIFSGFTKWFHCGTLPCIFLAVSICFVTKTKWFWKICPKVLKQCAQSLLLGHVQHHFQKQYVSDYALQYSLVTLELQHGSILPFHFIFFQNITVGIRILSFSICRGFEGNLNYFSRQTQSH